MLMRNFVRAVVLTGLSLSLAAESTAAEQADSLDYARDIWPILQTHCVGCHGSEAPEGGLNIEDFTAFAAGGEHGPAFTSGAPGSSRMLQMASGKLEPQMPPEGEQPLSEEQLAMLANWIEQGAIGPDGNAALMTLNIPQIPPAEASQQPVTAVAVAPAGDRIAVARFGHVEIRDAASDAVLQTIDTGAGKWNSLQFNDTGEHMLVAGGTAGLNGRAAIYEIHSGQLLAEFGGHGDALFVARYSGDGQRIATAGYDRKIIIWDVPTQSPLQTLEGHNGAIYQVAFSADGKLLVSASADETAKVWSVETGQRLDTLPQPQGEVFAVALTPDGRQIVAVSADNRLRVWDLVSRETPQINPLRVTRYADDAPLTHAAISADGRKLVVISESGNLKVFDCRSWSQFAEAQPLGDTASGLAIMPDGSAAIVSLMNGDVRRIELPSVGAAELVAGDTESLQPVYLQLDPAATIDESQAAEAMAKNPSHAPRGLSVTGVIKQNEQGEGETDTFALGVRRGEVWVVETEAASLKSPLDTVVEILDADSDQPLIAARLQAVRDSYFTFRGKDGTQSGDFRMFAWEEMELNDLLYASGEVTKLWMYPRGPDSGFNVYPGAGQRWTYFGTTGVAHALGEPAYIVRPLAAGEEPLANGLPVFEIPLANDDDPQRQRGTDSQVIFTAPSDGRLLIRLRDTRGHGGEDYRYKLTARPAAPNFVPRVSAIGKPIPPGAGREMSLQIDRIDGFDGPVRFDIEGLPPGLHSTSPVTIEAGQNQAFAMIWADASLQKTADAAPAELTMVATAQVAGRHIEHRVEGAGSVSVGDPPQLTLALMPADHDVGLSENWTLALHPGETVRARVVAVRQGHSGEIALGNETAGRNTHHGVFVDNIGLSGLLIKADASEREFFLTAAPITAAGKRSFYLKTNVDGGLTSPPITVEVLPPSR